MEKICLGLIMVVILSFIGLIFIWGQYVMFKHTPRQEIPENIREHIIEKGLIHFTYYENAIKIKYEGLVPKEKKAMKRAEKNMVWMYLYDSKTFNEKLATVRKKGSRKNYDAVVFFKGITEKQIDNMKIRKKQDDAIVHLGPFFTEIIEIEKLEKEDGKSNVRKG